MSTPHFTYGLATTKGTERKVNNDAVFALTWSDVPRFSGQNVGLFIVADGCYVENSGISASQLAVQIVAEEITADIFQQSEVSINLILTAAVREANRQVIAKAEPDGTTLTAALIIGDLVHIAHVGDTRAYYIYGNDLIQLTYDHRIIQRYIDLKYLTWEEVQSGKTTHMGKQNYRLLGIQEKIEIDIHTKRLEPGSSLLLSTDGLWGLHWDYIDEIKQSSALQNNSSQLACDNLIDLAQKGGSGDDISVIVVKLSEQ